jgi:hypothetical protein
MSASQDQYNDYWKLTIERNVRPEGITYNVDKRCYSGPYSTYHLQRALLIRKVEIYEKTEVIGEEQLKYDYGIVFYLEDDITLVFFPMESIADAIEMNVNKEHINQALNDCSLRSLIV